MWQLVIIVSVYRRQFWINGLTCGEQPDHECTFKESLPNGASDTEVSQAMRRLCERCEKWIDQKKVRLVTHLVVTVYSMEMMSYDSCSSS